MRRGVGLVWTSRDARKHHLRLNPAGDSRRGSAADTLWAPRRIAWWIGLLFMAGAACFGVASLPGLPGWTSSPGAALTCFVGSIFFTSAAYLQFVEAINVSVAGSTGSAPEGERRTPEGKSATPAGEAAAPQGEPAAEGERRTREGEQPHLRLLALRPLRLDWWMAVVQLTGTLLFNVNTFWAMDGSLSAVGYDHHVWVPDSLGSICFLIASYLALAEVRRSWWRLWGHGLPWSIAAVNVAGSVAFGVSAIAALKLLPAGTPRNSVLADWGTFVGAACFFAGAALLLPESAGPPAEED